MRNKPVEFSFGSVTSLGGRAKESRPGPPEELIRREEDSHVTAWSEQLPLDDQLILRTLTDGQPICEVAVLLDVCLKTIRRRRDTLLAAARDKLSEIAP